MVPSDSTRRQHATAKNTHTHSNTRRAVVSKQQASNAKAGFKRYRTHKNTTAPHPSLLANLSHPARVGGRAVLSHLGNKKLRLSRNKLRRRILTAPCSLPAITHTFGAKTHTHTHETRRVRVSVSFLVVRARARTPLERAAFFGGL